MSSERTHRVAVVGGAQTQLRECWPHLQHIDLISQAVDLAVRGTGLRMQDIDVIIDCGSDVLDGRSISNCGFLGAMGAHRKEESRVEEDGLFGALYAATKIAAGGASVALVVAYSKPSESNIANYYGTLAEPFYQRPVGLDHLTAAGLMANQYLTLTSADESSLARIAAAAWANAATNPMVDGAVAWTVDDVLSAPMVADPLTSLALSRPVDGAIAVLLANEHVARRVTARPVWITGMGAAIDSHFLSERLPGQLEACGVAARMAMSRAGIDGASSIALLEVSAGSAAAEAMALESMGLAEPGRAADLYKDGSGVLVNPSGGAIPADPVMATGLIRLHEAAQRLAAPDRAEAGAPAGRALVHGSGGIGMQNHCVFTLEV